MEAFSWLLIFIISGILAWGLLLGEILSQCEEHFKKNGILGGKEARLRFKSMLVSAFIVRMILGTMLFPSSVIYRLIMRQPFRFDFFLPKGFWEKHFDDTQP